MQTKFTRQVLGIHLLRLGLASVFLWFGFSQLMDGIHWVAIVPDWAVNLFRIPPAMIVLANGLFEVLAATFLAMGLLVRFSSFILAFHLLIIAGGFGITANGIRDFGLAIATLSLFLMFTKVKVKTGE